MKNTKLIALFVCLTIVVCSFAGCTMPELPFDVSGIPVIGDLFVKTAAIEFNANGGELVGEAPAAYSDNAALALPSASLQYYDFIGWSLNADGSGDLFVDEIPAKFALTEDQIANGIVLYAVWEQLVGNIEYDFGGGEWEDEAGPSSYNYGSVVEIPALVKENFEFLGWTLDGEEFEGIVESTEGDLTLVASWLQVKTKISFVLGKDGAVLDNAVSLFETADGLDLGAFIPSAEGVEFAGWYLTPDCSGPAISEIPADTTDDVVVYANWATAPAVGDNWVPAN